MLGTRRIRLPDACPGLWIVADDGHLCSRCLAAIFGDRRLFEEPKSVLGFFAARCRRLPPDAYRQHPEVKSAVQIAEEHGRRNPETVARGTSVHRGVGIADTIAVQIEWGNGHVQDVFK